VETFQGNAPPLIHSPPANSANDIDNVRLPYWLTVVGSRSAITMGFFVAPLVATITGAVISPAWQGGHVTEDLLWALAWYLMTLAFGIALGLPLLVLFARYRLVTWWSALAAGCLAGSAVAMLLHLPIELLGSERAAAGFAFWIVWKIGPEPDPAEVKEFLRQRR